MEADNGLDSLNIINHKTDTIVHQVQLIQNNSEVFFTMENPFWYIITLLLGGYFTYRLTRKAKKEEVVTEAKRILLDKRIDAHTKLFEIFSKGRYVSGKSNEIYYKIFSSFLDFTNWFDDFLTFAGENKLLLCKSVNMEVTILSNLRQLIHELVISKGLSDDNLKSFGIKHQESIEEIFSKVEHSFTNYFETGISLDFHNETLTDSDFKKIGERFNSYRIVKELTK